MGIEVRAVEFNDELVRGITALFNETPFRQGRRFPHYGKDFAQVKKEVGGLLERSEFIGAFLQGELVGYLKLVYMGPLASLLNLVSMDRHYDKRPSNALMAKAVELCTAKGKSFLVYGKYTYGKKGEDSMTEFKRRNGFEQIEVPRYVVPLTLKGRLAARLGLHRGLLEALPQPVVRKLLELRAGATRRKMAQAAAGQPAGADTTDKSGKAAKEAGA
jgi:1-acyl-sn-glycerol-3-phosphate acyltransferase